MADCFDNELFGLLLRRARRDAGFASVEDFLEAVEFETGFVISKDTAYKIENGKAKLSIDAAAAINITLYGRANAPQFWTNFNIASSQEWKDIEAAALADDIARGMIP